MCTSVRFTDKAGNMFFGRNLDWSCTYGAKVLIAPRNFAEKWDFIPTPSESRSAAIGMGIVVEGKPLFFDCSNECGLSAAGLNFPGFAQYESTPVEGKTNLAAYEFPYWVAANFKTVDEAEKAIENVAIVGQPIGQFQPAMLHWIIADRTRAIVVEYMDSGMHIHHDDADVLANQPQFDWHRENLRNYMALSSAVPADTQWRGQKLDAYGSGFGMLGLPGGYSSPDRFVRAAYLNANYPVKESESDNVDRLFHTLLGVSMIDGAAQMTDGNFERTLFTDCYSEASKTYYWNTYDNLAVQHICLSDYDLDGKDIIG